MRNDPRSDWSNSLGVFAWPEKNTSQDATLGLFYTDIEELQRDYRRATQWQTDGSVRRSVSTLYLEKTTCGHAWINFGARHYLKKRTWLGKDRAGRKYIEPPSQRIAVPIYHGAKNRKLIANRTRGCSGLWVIFASYDGQEPQALNDAVGLLRSDCLGAAPATEPVLLSGLCTLKNFHSTL